MLSGTGGFSCAVTSVTAAPAKVKGALTEPRPEWPPLPCACHSYKELNRGNLALPSFQMRNLSWTSPPAPTKYLAQGCSRARALSHSLPFGSSFCQAGTGNEAWISGFPVQSAGLTSLAHHTFSTSHRSRSSPLAQAQSKSRPWHSLTLLTGGFWINFSQWLQSSCGACGVCSS